MARKPVAPSPCVPGDGVISTIHASGVNARFGLPLSGVLCLGLIDHSLQRLEGRVTTAVRLDASCVRPQRQERHNVIRSICRSSFAGLGVIRLVLCAFRVHIFYLMLALTRDESSRLHARFHHLWPCEVDVENSFFSSTRHGRISIVNTLTWSVSTSTYVLVRLRCAMLTAWPTLQVSKEPSRHGSHRPKERLPRVTIN